MIEKLFQFFDDHKDVPQALIVSEDGDVTRSANRVAGTPGVQEGYFVPKVYDLDRRLGNTGVSSALVAINLASMASYLDGGTSAVVYNGNDGTTVQMVRPPDEATKAQKAKTRWAAPFLFGAPGVTQ